MYRLTLTFLLLFLPLAIVGVGKTPKENENLIVKTDSGWVKGLSKTTVYGGKKIITFLGIPFAKPPTKNRRFKVNVAKTNVISQQF